MELNVGLDGKKRRLRRIMPDGRTVVVPMDHGVSSGPIKGLDRIAETIRLVGEGGCDAIVVHKGIAKALDTGSIGLIIHLSASTSLSEKPNWKVAVGGVKEALKLGCDAVSVHINVGAEHENRMLSMLGSVAGECDEYGVPLLAMMYPRGPKISSEHDPEAVAHAARLGAELGADIVKTNYTGDVESFRMVVESCPVPVIIAGGPKASTVEGLLQMVYDSLKAGGAGVSIGRNVFQHSHPDRMAAALASLVHRGATVEQGLKLLGEA
ncbi:MAG: 2-amino-3,7-dideoxy-D-threo-hept-6-ulosonate synthase [Candidatus Bathyarchaeia archaeon]